MNEDPGKDSVKSLAENYDRQEANQILYYVTVLGEYLTYRYKFDLPPPDWNRADLNLLDPHHSYVCRSGALTSIIGYLQALGRDEKIHLSENERSSVLQNANSILEKSRRGSGSKASDGWSGKLTIRDMQFIRASIENALDSLSKRMQKMSRPNKQN